MVAVLADLSVEQGLLATGAQFVIGVDEVGRGALAGPVSVGAALVSAETCDLPLPAGLTDSKKLSPARRTTLDAQVRAWALSVGVGHASPAEIDEFGLTAALRLAGLRAIAQLDAQLVGVPPSAVTVLLDGKHNWLAAPAHDLLSLLAEPAFATSGAGDRTVGTAAKGPAGISDLHYPVVTRVKADLFCASVSAAAIAAKCTRDTIMSKLGGPQDVYGWAGNKGYGSSGHIAALGAHGASEHHRRSWSLPGIEK